MIYWEQLCATISLGILRFVIVLTLYPMVLKRLGLLKKEKGSVSNCPGQSWDLTYGAYSIDILLDDDSKRAFDRIWKFC